MFNSDGLKGAHGKILHDYLQSMEREAFFSGSVLIDRGEDRLLCEGYGQSNSFNRNTPSTIFQLASLTKQFTAAAIMKLSEEKKIDIHGFINHYLPKECQCSRWKEITVAQLLSHESGMSDYTDCDDYWDICQELTPDSIIEQAKGQRLLFSPGEDYCYSNTGYDLLGKIIEQQSGLSYKDYVTQNIFVPAGMHSSGVRMPNQPPPIGGASGFYVEDQNLVPDPRDENTALYADGAAYSTVLDLAKWSKVLTGQQSVLSPESIKLMLAHEYGLMVDDVLGPKRIYHYGSMAGFTSSFCLFPKEKLLLIVLCNNADFVAEYITSKIAKFLLLDKPLNPIIPFPKGFNYSPFLTTFISEEDDEDEYTFERKGDRLILDEDDPVECCLLENGHLFIPSEGNEYKLQRSGALTVYDGDGEEVDTLIIA